MRTLTTCTQDILDMRNRTFASLSLMLLMLPNLPAMAQPTPPVATHLIDVGGHKIAFHVTPGHGPAIVLDAGGGLDSSYWDALVPELAKRTGSEVITYDRAGFGASDDVSGAWNVHSATRDLAVGLEKLHATHRVILVSHSLAGEIATYLVGQHPKWFVGGVLVDANVPDYFTDEAIARSQVIYAPIVAATRAAPPSRPGRQLLALSSSFVETSRAFHGANWPATVPAIVIVSEKTPFDDQADAKWWRDAHAQFAGHAPNRQLVSAAGSSHDVAHDRPDVILSAISELATGSLR
jgi:pimeloyl-ACP methyl ester carboxylesterase